MPIKPFRQYSENDVINGLWKFDGATPALAGTFVKAGSGWHADQHSAILGAAGNSYGNTVSPRWGLPATVVPTAASGDAAIGMLLYDVRETDENGEKLLFHPRKAEENNWTISGYASSIVTRGVFLYSGVKGATPTAGTDAYLDSTNALNTSGSKTNLNVTRMGKFLSGPSTDNFVLFKLEL
jgi:hypothetical protein